MLVDHQLSGVIVGLTLATRPEQVYRALLESTAFGTRRIIDAFTDSGVAVDEFIVAGGLRQNAVLMQLYADVLGRTVAVAGAEQAPALGSAIHAAVAAGAYSTVTAAANSMGRRGAQTYHPDPARSAGYNLLYADYRRLHDWFGLPESAGGNRVLHRLRARRDAAVSASGVTAPPVLGAALTAEGI